VLEESDSRSERAADPADEGAKEDVMIMNTRRCTTTVQAYTAHVQPVAEVPA
jgi:hypothetical protein